MNISSWKVIIYDIFAYIVFKDKLRTLQLYATDNCSKQAHHS